MQTVFEVSPFSLCVPVAYHLHQSSKSSSLDPNVLFVAGTSLSGTCRRCLQCPPSPCVCQWRTICTAAVKAAPLTQMPLVCAACPLVSCCSHSKYSFKVATKGILASDTRFCWLDVQSCCSADIVGGLWQLVLRCFIITQLTEYTPTIPPLSAELEANGLRLL